MQRFLIGLTSPNGLVYINLQLVVLEWLGAGLDEDTFHDRPVIVGIGAEGAVDLQLTPDGVAVLLACYGEEGLGPHVL